MRKLIYVPVIHVDTDMGSIAPTIDKRSGEICGRDRWEKHKQTVTTFWDQIEEYFKTLNAGNLKIYQDGLMAAGDLGQKIIKEGAGKGSRNYLIVLDLIKRGAEIRKTEDIALLKEEYDRILKLAQSKSLWERTTAYIGYRFHKDRLMEKRDRFIAETINATLKDGEKGVLFIGAFHDVFPYLAKDVSVEEVKYREKVRDYFKMLISGGDQEKFDELAEYLVDSGQWTVNSEQQPATSNQQTMTKIGQYIYAIVGADEERNFGAMGIGGRSEDVCMVCYKDIGAVISPSPIVKYPVTRANTMAHQKVMEEAMKYYAMLPVRFGTIGEGDDLIREKVLKVRYGEFKDLLGYMEDKIELGLKALWTDMQAVYREIVDENRDIRLLKQRLISKKISLQKDGLKLGEMVKNALDVKRKREEGAILNIFKGLWADYKKNEVFGDQMITNSAFLVPKDREKEFDDKVGELLRHYDGRMKLKYVGPIPPCNFVEISITW